MHKYHTILVLLKLTDIIPSGKEIYMLQALRLEIRGDAAFGVPVYIFDLTIIFKIQIGSNLIISKSMGPR